MVLRTGEHKAGEGGLGGRVGGYLSECGHARLPREGDVQQSSEGGARAAMGDI